MSDSPPRRTLTLKKAPKPSAEGSPRGAWGDRTGRKPGSKPAGSPVGKKPFSAPPRSSDRHAGKQGQREGAPSHRTSSSDDPWAKWRSQSTTAAPTPKQMPQQTVTQKPPPPTSTQEGVRLSKIMAERGLCSRREADAWIERGWVFVDGERITTLGTRISPDAEVSISKEAKQDQARHVTILLNKPVGYVSGQPEPGFTPAAALIGADNQVCAPGDPAFAPWMLRGLAPAGRLDIDSTGLLVLTQDGRIARQLIGEDSQVEKEYLVRVSGELIPNGLELLNFGLSLDGKPLKRARVKQLNPDQLHFILREGKKRQIRRMCELVGLHVTGLKRVRIGNVRLGDLPLGQWRLLHSSETF